MPVTTRSRSASHASSPLSPARSVSVPLSQRSGHGGSGGGAPAALSDAGSTITEGTRYEWNPPDIAPDTRRAARQPTLSKPPHGFRNPGNFCYRNSVVMMLLHSDRIMSWIEHRHIPTLHDAGLAVHPALRARLYADAPSPAGLDALTYTDVWCELHELYRFYCTGPPQAKLNAAMLGLWEHWSCFLKVMFPDDTWHENEQEDADEFLRKICELSIAQLRDCCHRIGVWGLNDDADATEHLSALCALAESTAQRSNTIEELLLTHFGTRTQCAVCQYGTNKRRRQERMGVETVWQMPLSDSPGAPGRGTLALEGLIASDMHSELTNWRCASCEGRTDIPPAEVQSRKTVRSVKLLTLPEVFALSLTRFEFGPRGTLTKNNRKVTFPEVLDLGPHLDKGVSDRGATKYRLASVVSHMGTRRSGHYICDIRAAHGQWWEMDDDAVSAGSLEIIVERQNRDQKKKWNKPFTPYILLYEKIVQPEEGDAPTPTDLGVSAEDTPDDYAGRAEYEAASAAHQSLLALQAAAVVVNTAAHGVGGADVSRTPRKRAASADLDGEIPHKRQKPQTPQTSPGGPPGHAQGLDGSLDQPGRGPQAASDANRWKTMATFHPSRVVATGAVQKPRAQGRNLTTWMNGVQTHTKQHPDPSRKLSLRGQEGKRVDDSPSVLYGQPRTRRETSTVAPPTQPSRFARSETPSPEEFDASDDDPFGDYSSSTGTERHHEHTGDDAGSFGDPYWSSEAVDVTDSDATSTAVEDYLVF